MNLIKRKEKKKYKTLIGIVLTIGILLGFLFYKTFALYEIKKDWNVMQGSIPPQDYDALLTFYYEDENGHQTPTLEIPKGNYIVKVTCTNEAIGSWDYEAWGPNIRNVNQSRTKCQCIYYGQQKTLKDVGISSEIVTNGDGLYKITHEGELNASSKLTETQKAYLKLPEYRYAGTNPKNYVWFNDELWRLIGLINTPEGQRIKLIRQEAIGKYSFNSSDASINEGRGENEWSTSSLMHLLNPGYESESVGGSLYWNRLKGSCYIGANHETEECDFTANGLSKEAKEMIDTNWWFTGYALLPGGSMDEEGRWDKLMSVESLYNLEKSGIEKRMPEDTPKKTLWQGKVALMSPSDYKYAASGTENFPRKACLNTMFKLNEAITDCEDTNWIYNTESPAQMYLLNPWAGNVVQFTIDWTGRFNGYDISHKLQVIPTIYLKENIKINSGEGTTENPYTLILEK